MRLSKSFTLDIKLGLMKNFAKANGRNWKRFYVFDGKVSNANFKRHLNDLEKRASIFQECNDATFRQKKSDNYRDQLMKAYEHLDCNMSVNIRFLHSPLGFLSGKPGSCKR